MSNAIESYPFLDSRGKVRESSCTSLLSSSYMCFFPLGEKTTPQLGKQANLCRHQASISTRPHPIGIAPGELSPVRVPGKPGRWILSCLALPDTMKIHDNDERNKYAK